MMNTMLFHIATLPDWNPALKTGEYTTGSLLTEGFIHCSHQDQLEEVANRYFRGRTDLVLLTIDPSKVAAEIRIELAQNGKFYPHIYGTIPLTSVTQHRPWKPEADGTFRLS